MTRSPGNGVRPAGSALKSGRRDQIRSIVAALAAMSVATGVIVAAITLPVVGMAGVGIRDAAETFNNLPVPALSKLPTRSEILDASGECTC